MDDKAVWYQYAYDWSANDNHAVFTGANAAGSNAEGVDGSTAWSLSMDSTSLAENTPSYAGGGSGGDGPVDYTIFDTGDLAAYRVTFDAQREQILEIRAHEVEPAEDTTFDHLRSLALPPTHL